MSEETFNLYESLRPAIRELCELAKATVVYQGKVEGRGKVFAVQTKVSTMQDYPAPNHKERAVVFPTGLVGYAWSFWQNFSFIVPASH